MFPWPVRLLGITLAGVELVLLAMNGLGFQFGVPFKDFIMRLGDTIAWVLRLEDIEAAIRAFLASFNFDLPKLSKHWHYVFVLMWLMLGSCARFFAGSHAVDAPLLSGPWFRNLINVDVPALIWALICALVAAVAAGTQPQASFAVLIWPMAGLNLFYAGLHLHGVLVGRLTWRGPRLLLMWLAAAAVLAITGYVTAAMPIRKPLFGIAADSPGLLFWVVLVGLSGLMFGAFGLLLGGSTWRERLTDPRTAFGVDIIGAYAIAFALAYVFGGGVTQG